jgi:zinc/manganese transport system substrate-binding protein
MRLVAVGLASFLLAACSAGSARGSAGSVDSVIHVVAGENFWGSIASQLGGPHAEVQSVVSDPNADPHEYESSANDARAMANANLVIVNGAGYDGWAAKLLQANPNSARRVLVVADLLGKKQGDNPHFWYGPDYVMKVTDAITAAYKTIDSADAAYFDDQRSAFATALQPYMQRLADIRQRFAGVPVGATESIFVYLADYLGLDLISPPEFMQSVAEGNDPPADTVVTFQNQIAQRAIKVLVYNVQTATAVTTNLKTSAAQHSIPVVGISETLQPDTASFQEWQVSQLVALENALMQ